MDPYPCEDIEAVKTKLDQAEEEKAQLEREKAKSEEEKRKLELEALKKNVPLTAGLSCE